ncbi:MAG: hypothetical protein PHS02_04835, partial [Candidatus ainarchaeum sp.]|nr:hypothetical protein [Candidatus ainarchaeum sp.]
LRFMGREAQHSRKMLEGLVPLAKELSLLVLAPVNATNYVMDSLGGEVGTIKESATNLSLGVLRAINLGKYKIGKG